MKNNAAFLDIIEIPIEIGKTILMSMTIILRL